MDNVYPPAQQRVMAGVLTDHVWSLLTIPIAFLINTNLEDDRIKSARVVIKTVLLLINRGYIIITECKIKLIN